MVGHNLRSRVRVRVRVRARYFVVTGRCRIGAKVRVRMSQPAEGGG